MEKKIHNTEIIKKWQKTDKKSRDLLIVAAFMPSYFSVTELADITGKETPELEKLIKKFLS